MAKGVAVGKVAIIDPAPGLNKAMQKIIFGPSQYQAYRFPVLIISSLLSLESSGPFSDRSARFFVGGLVGTL
jgi:hypothetical protein